ncbi:RNA polymerase subunit sigma-70 [Burkholderiales bacterium 8X]|nr:RNA polymerase subunit sigma-70 [Burkholderiales bacterium 8X]
MNIASHPELLELLAASHALGTLRGGARRRFEAIAREQPAVRAAAVAWQARLAGMSELQAPVSPDPAVWIRIRNLIEAEKEQAAIARRRLQAATETQPAHPAHPAQPAAAGWLRSLGFWRGVAGAGALATAVLLAVGLDLRQQLRTAPAVQYVAVLQDQQAAASMLVTFDPKNGQLTLQRLGGFREGDDKSLQLWALPPGSAPRSLGVLGREAALKLPAQSDEIRAVPALAVTLEPKGGVPPGQPATGPILFKGPLIEKVL